MHDITGMKRLQSIKRDFVSNVSHEMRTPLTAIKGYGETMGGMDEENESYLNIIKRHTDMLINIVGDLLILSEMEEIGMKLDLDLVDVNETISSPLLKSPGDGTRRRGGGKYTAVWRSKKTRCLHASERGAKCSQETEDAH